MDREILLCLIGALTGSGVMAVVQTILQRRWAKEDKQSAVVNALKVLMIDRIRYVGGCHIKAQGITLEDKETLKEMHLAYKALGGNGHLDTIMTEVEKLPLLPS